LFFLWLSQSVHAAAELAAGTINTANPSAIVLAELRDAIRRKRFRGTSRLFRMVNSAFRPAAPLPPTQPGTPSVLSTPPPSSQPIVKPSASSLSSPLVLIPSTVPATPVTPKPKRPTTDVEMADVRFISISIFDLVSYFYN
jgi:hypothetical protein